MAHTEEPSPFGSYVAAHIPDDAIPHVGAVNGEECVASVLESPFVSAQIDEDDFKVDDRKEKGKDSKDKPHGAAIAEGQQPQNSNTSTTSTATTVPGQLSKGNTTDMNNAPSSGVADMLESPFVSACMSQDLKDIEETLANAAAAAAQLAGATAAVKIST